MESLLSRLGLVPAGTLFGNPLVDWVSALSIGLTSFAALLLLRRFLLRRAEDGVDHALPGGVRLLLTLAGRTRYLPLLALSLLAGSKYLDFTPKVERVTSAVLLVIITLQSGLWASTATRFWLDEQSRKSGSANSRTMVTIVDFVARVVIWSIVLLLVLDNLGIQVKALLTGLGIGGIAVALAVQNVLGDLLASLSIALDQSFGVGDALVLDTGYAGTVEAIGIKSTRLRSISGEQIVLANSELVKARIRNYGRLRERRSVFRLNIEHGTPASDLEAIPGLIRDAALAQPGVNFERAHLITFSTNAIEFEAVYSVASADYPTFLDAQQAINLTIAREFEARGISFASLTPVMPHPAVLKSLVTG